MMPRTLFLIFLSKSKPSQAQEFKHCTFASIRPWEKSFSFQWKVAFSCPNFDVGLYQMMYEYPKSVIHLLSNLVEEEEIK